MSNSVHKYILVIVDQFTKWVQSYPLADQTATLVEKLVHEFITHLGTPLEIHSDQGWNVDGQLLQDVCRLMEMRKTRTTPYQPSCNGLVERFN